jgi:hypothetical protein
MIELGQMVTGQRRERSRKEIPLFVSYVLSVRVDVLPERLGVDASARAGCTERVAKILSEASGLLRETLVIRSQIEEPSGHRRIVLGELPEHEILFWMMTFIRKVAEICDCHSQERLVDGRSTLEAPNVVLNEVQHPREVVVLQS